jgi:hypothetical protein
MTEHLDTVSLSRYIDGAGASDERARCEAHLAECPDCRVEMVEVGRILAAAPRSRRRVLVPLAAAAAALLLVWTGNINREPSVPVVRDPDSMPALAPRPVAPLGDVSRPDGLTWRAVPDVARYRVTLFTVEGQAAWQTTTTDTFVALPDTVRLSVATPQYWQVKAETGFGRWIESELVTFTIRRADTPE